MTLTYAQQRLLDRARRAASKRLRGQEMDKEALSELRAVWVKARAERIPSHVIAEASGVSPESVRMEWNRDTEAAS